MSKFNQRDFRKLIPEKKSKLDDSKQILEKINSPLAKYDRLGHLTCVICKTIIKSTAVWKVHINSKQHKSKVDIAKNLKAQILNTPLDTKCPRKTTATTSTTIQIHEQKHAQPNIASTVLVRSPEKLKVNVASSGEDILPEKFFDDPVKDAKIRNADYKDSQDEEWERFQREIKEESTMSNAIIAGEQDEAAVLREIEEIDEQMNRWNRFMDMDKKKKTILAKGNCKGVLNENVEENHSTDESDSFDEFSDWRSKVFHK